MRKLLQGPRGVALWVTLAVVGGALFLAPSFKELTAPLDTGAARAAEPDARQGAVEVMHFWNAGSEREALNVFRDAYAARGGGWIDSALPDHASLRRAMMDRFSTGTPPEAVLWQSNIELRDLAELGLFVTLDDVARRENWDETLAPAVRARVQVNGHYYIAPTNVHGLNWIFYNTALLDRIGVGRPTTWDDVLTAMQRAEAIGVRGVAIGPGDWEGQMAFAAILAGTLGRDDYRRLMTHRDASILEKPGALEAFRIFGEFRDIALRHEPYPDWPRASHAVARGEAAFEFMGDWAKGEMMRVGAVPGRDVGCVLAPGSENALILTVDGFAFPTDPNSPNPAARRALASLLLDATSQRRFASVKGTIAARSDAMPTRPDACEITMIHLLRDPQAPLEPPNAALPSAQAGDYQIAIAGFFRDRDMTPQQGLALLRRVFEH